MVLTKRVHCRECDEHYDCPGYGPELDAARRQGAAEAERLRVALADLSAMVPPLLLWGAPEGSREYRATHDASDALTRARAALLASPPDAEPPAEFRLALSEGECGELVPLFDVPYGEQYDPCRKPKGHTGHHDPSEPVK